MKPKFTDGHKYPRGYKQACDTDITKTWKAAREKMEQLEKEREAMKNKIKELPSIGRKHG